MVVTTTEPVPSGTLLSVCVTSCQPSPVKAKSASGSEDSAPAPCQLSVTVPSPLPRTVTSSTASPVGAWTSASGR
ncbi:hypothetical protein IU11_12745 [Cellulosimicrobium sp. MM]|nr:hypothetical protein IU11_12745 [Cellulosimicrobium sp. MM]